MDTDERRAKILRILESQKTPISGSELAALFDVTRQVIVQDIAILRAFGHDIISTSKGYMSANSSPLCSKKIAVRHGEKETREELMIFVSCGLRVLDVIVEHPLYGELHGMLMLQNSNDVQEFIHKMEHNQAALLSQLTDGVHLHTVEALNKDSITKAEMLLKKKGILLE